MFFTERLNVSPEAREVAESNADVAFDQRYSKAYGGSAVRAIAAHAQNAADTLQERSIVDDYDAVMALYYARVAVLYSKGA